ncbi:MAG: ABC transporter permease subunit [Thermodesulfobacteriota bacterium]
MTNIKIFSLVAAALLLFLVAPSFMPYNIGQPGQRLAAPSLSHWLGTDRLGRDVAYRSIAGIVFSLGRAITVLILAVAVGVTAAVLSTIYYRQGLDRSLVILAETIRSFPFIILMLLFLAIKFPLSPIFVAYYWVPVWRLMRGALASQRHKPYVLAASFFGWPKVRVIFSELLPNLWIRLFTNLPAILADILASLSALEFLGIGVEIRTPSLGGQLLDSVQLGFRAPWCWLPSLVGLVFLVWGLTFISRQAQRKQAWTPLG